MKALPAWARRDVVRDAAAIPVLIVGFLMLLAMGTEYQYPAADDALFAGTGGDYHETYYGVHGSGGVYPLRIKYHDSPGYRGPPVIIVHGMGTSDAYLWRVEGEVDVFAGFIFAERRRLEAAGLAQGLADLGVDVVTYTYPDSRDRPLEYQAYDLGRVTGWTKDRFVKKDVVLVGHSTGGLICYYYLVSGQPGRVNYQFPAADHPEYAWNPSYNVSDYDLKHFRYQYDVARLFLVATPNLGNLTPEGRDYGSPALFEMKENADFLTWLEEGRRRAAAERYVWPDVYVFAGTAFEKYMGQNPLNFGDGIVTVASAVGNWEEDPRCRGRVYRYPLDHFQLAMDGGVLATIYNALAGPGN